MMFVTEDKTIVMLLRKRRCRWYRLCCIGRKSHYRKDGSCKHTTAVLAQIKPGLLSRVKVDGFGGRKP